MQLYFSAEGYLGVLLAACSGGVVVAALAVSNASFEVDLGALPDSICIFSAIG